MVISNRNLLWIYQIPAVSFRGCRSYPLTSAIRDRAQSSTYLFGSKIWPGNHMSITFLLYISYIIMASWYKDMIISSYIIASPILETVNHRFNQPPWPNPFPTTSHKPIIFQPRFLRILCKSQHLNRLKYLFTTRKPKPLDGPPPGEIAVCLSVFIMTWCFSEKKWKKAMWISLDMDIARATHKENWFLMKQMHDFKKKSVEMDWNERFLQKQNINVHAHM